jgi:hypothetical protein
VETERYFFNVLMGSRTVVDPEGSEFASLGEARREAEQTARDLAAEKLQLGSTVGENWRIDIADAQGNVHTTVNFVTAILHQQVISRKSRAANGFQEQHARAQAVFEETRVIAANVAATFAEIRARMAQLS